MEKPKKKSVRKTIPIRLSLEDADTMIGFIDGSIGCAEDEAFVKWGKRILKMIKKEYSKSKNQPTKNGKT